MKHLILLCATMIGGTHAIAQTHIGNGGDPLMMIFDQARNDSVHLLKLIAGDGIPATVRADVRDFLKAPHPDGSMRIQAMAQDVEDSPHRWRSGDVGFNRCAVTNKPGDEQAVYLSVDKCREIFSYSVTPAAEAIRTLIHESVHHFGIGGSDSDEAFATAVADTVFKLWIRARQQTAARWNDVTVANAPEARFSHSAVWTGRYQNSPLDNQVLIWGGCNLNNLPNPDTCSTYLNNGGALSIRRDQISGELATAWRPLDESDAPLARRFHTAVWTGSQKSRPDDQRYRGIDDRMIIFGGCIGASGACNHSYAVTACADGTTGCSDANRDHVIYNPANDSWSAAEAGNSPSPRIWHSAVWGDNEMLIWGGLTGYERSPAVAGDGGRLVFSSGYPRGQWLPMPTDNAPAPRYGHASVWTGKSMVVWGGCAKQSVFGCSRWHNDGGIYEPGKGWTKRIPGPAFLQGRTGHSMVFTGRYIIVWGGRNGTNTQLDDGGIFDLEGETGWRQISNLLPTGETGRHSHTAVYDFIQGRMIIWGGETSAGPNKFPNTTLIYDVGENKWPPVATNTAPGGRKGHTSLWIDDSLVIWGGIGAGSDTLITGGIFNP
jgi:hypothetical protein